MWGEKPDLSICEIWRKKSSWLFSMEGWQEPPYLYAFWNNVLPPLWAELALLGPELCLHQPKVKLLIYVTCIYPCFQHNSATCHNCWNNTRMRRLPSCSSHSNLDKHCVKATSLILTSTTLKKDHFRLPTQALYVTQEHYSPSSLILQLAIGLFSWLKDRESFQVCRVVIFIT